ncbi:TPA: type IV conjugative transfer system coupling protein TraD [Legionella anisa]|uniref:type IV conjugative transfer system coupling protein TraD n=1 Tax=Legionella anisa TaxID=28082 RepID=UPI001981FDDE|nr:type IV conjugative transfer system coupling protein TraD [Legionella anisa]MBN5937219.1 type IV conjugative transfer system coupling protein TraD [Legionella anisa]
MKQKGIQFLRGSQIFDYSTKMMVHNLNRIFVWAFIGYVFLVLCLMLYTSFPELKLLVMQVYCDFLKRIGFGHQVVWQEAGAGQLSAQYFLTSAAIQSAVHNAQSSLLKHGMHVLIVGGVIYCAIVAFFIRFFINKGEKYSKDRLISGTKLAKSPSEVIRSIKKGVRGISDVRLLTTLPLPARSEFQGFFFHGSTGSGKTQAMMRLLDEIRRLGEPAIIYDKECTIKPYFFDKDLDIELNPVAKDCANWDLWSECDNPMELGNLATYLIPKAAQGTDPFWVDSARTILTSMAWKIRAREDKNAIFLLQLLLTTTLDEMRGILKGTESENLVSKEIEKTAISIKSVLATYTKALRFLEGLNTEDAPKFSIKEWVHSTIESTQPKKGWLFITSRSKYHKEIKPLISVWLGLAMQAIQSLKPNSNKRIWLVMDELASLQRLEMLSDTLADIRKFGGCVAIGIQSIAQLEFLYGTHEAHAITDLLNTSLYFRSPKSRVAKWVSDDLGEQVIEEVRESQSYGPNSIRDGNTIATQRVVRKTVDAGVVMTMEDLECFVRLIGDHPIARIKTDYIDRKQLMEPLIERSIDFDALEKINQQALKIQNDAEVNPDVKRIHQHEELAEKVAQNDMSPQELHESYAIETREAPIVIKELF